MPNFFQAKNRASFFKKLIFKINEKKIIVAVLGFSCYQWNGKSAGRECVFITHQISQIIQAGGPDLLSCDRPEWQ
jgi:hypothetical protein